MNRGLHRGRTYKAGVGGRSTYEVGGNHVGRKEAGPPGRLFSGVDGGQKPAFGFVGVSARAQKSLAALVSPSHCLICIPPQRRRKGDLGAIWVDQALPHFPCLPPPCEDSLPARMVGLGAQEVHWIGWAPLGVQRADKFSGNRRGGACPGSCRWVCCCPVSGFSAVAFLSPPQSPRLISLHFLCQTPVSGWVGGCEASGGGGGVQLGR